MQRHEYFTALGQADKFFNTTTRAMEDGKLSISEHRDLCAAAEKQVKEVFPKYGEFIMILPSRDPEAEFAGYTFIFEAPAGTEFSDVTIYETFQFDFKSVNIDVVG